MPVVETGDARIAVENGELRLEAGLLRRTWAFGPCGVRTTSVAVGSANLPLAGGPNPRPECLYDGLLLVPRRRGGPHPDLALKRVETANRPADAFEGQHLHLTLTWDEPVQSLRFVRKWSVYPGTSACVCHAEIRSESVPQYADEWKTAFENVIETLPLDLTGWRATAVRFLARTDYHNEYTRAEDFAVEPDGRAVESLGNLLFLENDTLNVGLFVLYEAPPEDERRPECRASFRVARGGVQVLGWGLQPHEVRPNRLRRSYSVAVGAYRGGRRRGLEALRAYLKARFPLRPGDRAVVANPWGDGQCYERFSEAYLLKEIAAAAAMGATHYQIDDGWQAGGTLGDITCNNRARRRDYWDVHPGKLPRGFKPLTALARRKGIELALWFCPDVARGYRNWEEERDLLLDLHRRHGIRLFKIDGIRCYTKDQEEAALNLLTGVAERSGGRVRLNLDVTNGLRCGYFVSQRFGTIFVENRYVIGRPGERTYFPWKVLRNLWRLAWYVPPEKLQFEFANLTEAAQNPKIEWDRGSRLTPFNCSWEYVTAVALFASPLCWLQPSRVTAAARRAIRRVLDLQRRIASELGAGFTFPLGEEPTGHSWTGFWSHAPGAADRGLLLAFREDTPRRRFAFQLDPELIAPGRKLRLRCLSHREPPTVARVNPSGAVRLAIPGRNQFRLYRYEVK